MHNTRKFASLLLVPKFPPYNGKFVYKRMRGNGTHAPKSAGPPEKIYIFRVLFNQNKDRVLSHSTNGIGKKARVKARATATMIIAREKRLLFGIQCYFRSYYLSILRIRKR